MFAHSAAVMINFFSITALFMAASLFGMEELSAEIAIVQGAIIAVFLSLSGHSKHFFHRRTEDPFCHCAVVVSILWPYIFYQQALYQEMFFSFQYHIH